MSFTSQKVLESTDTSIKMRHTDSSLILFHLPNSKSWLISLLAPVSTDLTLGDTKSRSLPKEGTQSSLPISVSSLNLHTWELFFSVLSGCHLGSGCDFPKKKSHSWENPTLVASHRPSLTIQNSPLMQDTATKICVVQALFYFRAYSSYPCWDLINSLNS